MRRFFECESLREGRRAASRAAKPGRTRIAMANTRVSPAPHTRVEGPKSDGPATGYHGVSRAGRRTAGWERALPPPGPGGLGPGGAGAGQGPSFAGSSGGCPGPPQHYLFESWVFRALGAIGFDGWSKAGAACRRRHTVVKQVASW